ncbi:MAG: hypothetical protein A2736_02615 [Candidatus Yanofskybacteria bacterium RIFCSPHIGHO2_01_FULL_41_27]|uniref:Uncharacterized protein n=1 Tax=Candidatus Yanofskybacteria bacterium RIFCSPHIGHO2_01_FULL_41_27 TaxID=1802662 RepID=A0A1F8EIA6_9BACT|nr:MAG: hypothetical protein A2736_02615 [Candidatus Yanofskybacteria bacterium RIFCSPHIGHO2_01_FULL_41_27]OGN09367.1 MAG: hypothetical protein A3C64_01940 [Candidatus Yanofskybacteria bacterium RIFCSPHIGHO2_02_FULL_41_12]
MRFLIIVSVLVIFLGAFAQAEEVSVQDFSALFSAPAEISSLADSFVYKNFKILIFNDSNGFRFEAHKILKVNGQSIRSDKAIRYFGQGFQQYAWDETKNCAGINDYFLLAGNTYRGWNQWSCATAGEMPTWTSFRRGQIIYVSYEYGREWAWAQYWNTKKGAETAAKKFVNFVTGIR